MVDDFGRVEAFEVKDSGKLWTVLQELISKFQQLRVRFVEVVPKQLLRQI